jgi:hypothetical protein
MLSFALFAVVATSPQSTDLTGAWTAKVQFTTGAFATTKDLEFLLVFNKGGTMTESSNYDSAPPVPPAYGIWKKTAKNQYQAKYVYYITKPPAKFDEISGGGGWMPAGKGELVEKITLAPNGQTYQSTLTMKMFDEKGKLGETWKANCRGVRMRF